MSCHKLRVLCLHGYAQSASKFRARTGPLRRLLKADMELVYIDAPHLSTEYAAADSLAWWNQGNTSAAEIDVSLDVVSRTLKNEGPFDGVLGFSQGAGLAAILMACCRPRLGFAILVAGFYPLDVARFEDALAAQGVIQTRTLVVIGAADLIVAPERGHLLASRAFAADAATVLTHEGGHHMPSNAEWRDKYRAFLQTCIEK
ncbi:hypothetical protein GGI20_002039 [Coemansia sp. BCRC 34301]|nr:hypothetical protein GGI20_002039 [Coemansia sp. BCRC 34301]